MSEKSATAVIIMIRSFLLTDQDRSSCNFCEQLCASSVQGGIECTCDSGYYLACDRVSCIGRFFFVERA